MRFVFFIMVLLVLALPVIITLIYRYFYTNHANKVLNGSPADRKWMSPFSVFLILFFLEIILVVIFGIAPANSSSDSGDDSYVYNNASETLTQSEIDQTLLSCFDGSEVRGYEMNEEVNGDFTYQLYHNTGDAMLPSYILRITYTGTENVLSWDDQLLVDSVGSGTLADFEENDAHTLYCIVSNNVEDTSDISYTLNLYDQTMDEYNTGDLGTYDMPDPTVTITLSVQ